MKYRYFSVGGPFSNSSEIRQLLDSDDYTLENIDALIDKLSQDESTSQIHLFKLEPKYNTFLWSIRLQILLLFGGLSMIISEKYWKIREDAEKLREKGKPNKAKKLDKRGYKTLAGLAAIIGCFGIS